MYHQTHFLAVGRAPRPDEPGVGLVPLAGGERVLWHGRAALAEYPGPGLPAGSPPNWTLPTSTEVLVTDRRLAFAHAVRPVTVGAPQVWPPYQALSPVTTSDEIAHGELRWQWPDLVAVRPGDAVPGADRALSAVPARPTRVGLVCATRDGTPTLVLAGGDLDSVAAADHLGNVLRRAIVQFRLDHAAMLGLPVPRARMLARLLIDPEFANREGGAGQAVELPGGVKMSGQIRRIPRLAVA